MSNKIYLSVNLKRIKAFVLVDEKEVRVISCTNKSLCSNYINCGALGKCPPYCEVVVAAKDYAFKRRTPMAEVFEITNYDLNILQGVQKYE